jgi:hypothetical protein
MVYVSVIVTVCVGSLIQCNSGGGRISETLERFKDSGNIW